MGTKEKVGALIILGGVALIGFYWFKKNKPTIASSQAKGLEELSGLGQKQEVDQEVRLEVPLVQH
jgi:hypothetical protein